MSRSDGHHYVVDVRRTEKKYKVGMRSRQRTSERLLGSGIIRFSRKLGAEPEQAVILLPPWLAHGCAFWFRNDARSQTGGEDQQTTVH